MVVAGPTDFYWAAAKATNRRSSAMHPPAFSRRLTGGRFFNANLFSKLFLKITHQKHYLQI
jgi:hypothetical protein